MRPRNSDPLSSLFGDDEPAASPAPTPAAPAASVVSGNVLDALEPRLRALLPAELYARVWVDPTADNLHDVFVHLRTLLRILYDQVPRHLAEDPPAAGAIRHEWQDGALMFTDLAGFTPFMEANSGGGRVGAEAVNAVLNRYLTVMIDIFGQAGGNLLEFTGDAMLIRFSADRRGDDVRRAVNAGLRMQRAMEEFAEIETPAGMSTLGMRIGIHAGRFLACDVGTPRRRDHVLFGEAVRRTKAAEGAGVVGRVTLTPEAFAEAGDRFTAEPIEDDFVLIVDDLTAEELDYFDLNPQVRRPRTPVVLDRSVEAMLVDIEEALALVEPLATYMPRPILDVIVETARDRKIPVEFATPVVWFVKLEGLDTDVDDADEESLDSLIHDFSALFAQIDAVVSARSGMLRKVTYQASGSDVLVAFGVLNAHTDDPVRSADAALAVRDVVAATAAAMGTDSVTCRIGMALGQVFAAEMGVHLGRREYNLIGDTVNVAARLTARAEPGTILVSPDLAAALDDVFTLDARGEMALKGKSEAMPVFEVVGRA